MSANDQMHSGIAEAKRLTRQGRLGEATVAIHRALGGAFVPAKEPVSSDGSNRPIDVTPRIVRRARQVPATDRHTDPNAATRTAQSPNLLTRGAGSPSETR